MASDLDVENMPTQYIDGEWKSGSGPSLDVVNPANARKIATVASSGRDDVDAGLQAARRALVSWRKKTPMERADYLRAIADLFEAERHSLETLLVEEGGKISSLASTEVDIAVQFLRYNAEWDRRLEGEILPGETPGEEIHLQRCPVGVVVAICPWNFPLAVLCRKIAPALLAGNTIVVKPSEVTPLATIRAFQLIAERVALPPGVLNLVTGGRETGKFLVDSPLTNLISFTGHKDTGKSIMASAAQNLTRVSLELGGKAPAIVWKDADLEIAIPAIVAARHTHSGQICTSAERVIVHQDLLDEFTERYVEAVGSLSLGNPADSVDMGPLASSTQLEKTKTAVSHAVSEGARVVAGGSEPSTDTFSEGYWYLPTVLRDVTPSMRIMNDETFGPVTPIIGVGSLDEALAVANDSRYGLSAYVFSRDYETVFRAVHELESGEIYVNRTLGESIHAHHSGFGESGIGGEDGKWGLLRYTQIKTVYHRYSN